MEGCCSASKGLMARSFIVFLVVDAEDALFADPVFALGGDEFADSVLADELQVFDLAHAVFRTVAFI